MFFLQVLSSNAQWENSKLENPLGNLRIEDLNENINTRCLEEKRKAVTSIMDDLNKEIEKAIVEVIILPEEEKTV